MKKKPEKKQCKFCYDLEYAKYINSLWEECKGIHKKYSVKLCEQTKEGHNVKSTIVYGSRPLNYCPECGRQLKKTRKKPE